MNYGQIVLTLTMLIHVVLFLCVQHCYGLSVFFLHIQCCLVKHKLANVCPYCYVEIDNKSFHTYSNICYVGHRLFLSIDHRFKYMNSQFDGSEQYREAVDPLSGFEVYK